MTRAARSALAAGTLLSWWCLTSIAWGATIQLVNADSAGEGLNDPTPVAPAGGNPATTLGDARRRALEQAFSSVACHLTSAVPINVSVSFDVLSCSAGGGVLASAGASSAAIDFPNAPRPATFYAAALANAIAEADLDPPVAEITMQVNSRVGAADCVAGSFWYYGFDGQAGSVNIDLFTIAVHELTHGLGFHTYVNMTTGEKLYGKDDAYMIHLTANGATPSSYSAMTDAQRLAANKAQPNLVWSGPALVADYGAPAALFAPSTATASSVNHFHYPLLQAEVMNPYYLGTNHALGRALSVLEDEGWTTHAQCIAAAPVPAMSPWSLFLLALGTTAVGIGAAAHRRPRHAQRIAPYAGSRRVVHAADMT